MAVRSRVSVCGCGCGWMSRAHARVFVAWRPAVRVLNVSLVDHCACVRRRLAKDLAFFKEKTSSTQDESKRNAVGVVIQSC
jgi:hypothetical protein